MKKIALSLAAVALSAMSFAALNPFAYGLKSELSADQTALTVTYSLNADATNVKVVVLDGETVVKTVECEGVTKGEYTVEVPTVGLPANTELTWKVEVTGAEVTAPTEHPTNYDFYHPSAVDIDNNPENPTFGLILCNEAMQSVKGESQGDTGEPYISTLQGAGIYAFNAAFEPMPNGDKPGYNGGIEFNELLPEDYLTSKGARITAYAPRRIRISEDGRIFVTSLDVNGTYLWEVNPENMDEWTPVFEGASVNDQAELLDAEGNFMVGPNCGFDVKGSGENLQLIMYSVNKGGITAAAMGGFKCAEYNLGTATNWTAAPSKMWVEGKYAINYNGTQVIYDNEGGIWIASYRGSATDLNPGIVHLNKDGVEDYKGLWNNMRNAGIRFNNDFTKLIVTSNNGTAKKATLYAVSKDNNGAPVLTEELVINMATVGNNLNDFAWDYAGNLYACGNSSEKLVAWAMPRTADEVVATPAASQYAITLSVGTFVENVEVVNQVQKVIRNGQVLIIRDGKTYNMMGQEVK